MSYPLHRLAPLYRESGPWSTVHLEVGWEVPDASRAIELRWRALREQLDQQGAPRRHLEMADDILDATAQPGGSACRHVVIGDDVAIDRTLRHDSPCVSEARYSEVPSVVPVVDSEAREAPYLVLEAARDGAVISAYQSDGTPVLTDEVTGETANLTKVPGGGWAHRRFQQTTEEVWRRNAQVVVSELERILQRASARLIILSGDVRAREKVLSQLSSEVRSRLVEVDVHTRPVGADSDATDRAVDVELDALDELERERILERFGDGRRHGYAVAGIGSTAHALRQAQVAVLMVDFAELAGHELLALKDEPWLATSQEGVTGTEVVATVPAADALVRAGALTGAILLPLPADRMPGAEPMAAVLRWPEGPR
jgi:hypothetical protein